MTHLNPEIVADRLIELGVSQDEFITALATPSKNKELAKLANEVLEKIRGQRNPNSYGAKFITELREHLKHHKESCGSPALEEPVKKFVHNPMSAVKKSQSYSELTWLVESCKKVMTCLEGKVDFQGAVKAFAEASKALSKSASFLKTLEHDQMDDVLNNFLTISIEFGKINADLLESDRFDVEAVADLHYEASALLRRVKLLEEQ